MNKEERIFRTNATKEWCEEMMTIYLKFWSDDDEIYKKLKQFYDKGLIKGMIYKNTSQPKKNKYYHQ